MSVIFDEVVGTVEEPDRDETDAPTPPPSRAPQDSVREPSARARRLREDAFLARRRSRLSAT